MANTPIKSENKEENNKDRMLAEQPTVTRSMIAPVQQAKPRKKESDSNLPTTILLSLMAMFAGGIVVNEMTAHTRMEPTRGSAEFSSTSSKKELEERVEFHRRTTGWKLNRDRIRMQLQNDQSGSVSNVGDPATAAVAAKSTDIMNGAPLIGEKDEDGIARHEGILRQRDPATFADKKTMKAVSLEKAYAEAERVQQNQYVKDFIDNANKEGFDVDVDDEGNVFLKGVRNPTSKNEVPIEPDGMPGAVR